MSRKQNYILNASRNLRAELQQKATGLTDQPTPLRSNYVDQTHRPTDQATYRHETLKIPGLTRWFEDHFDIISTI